MPKVELSVVIPIFNEGQTLRANLMKLAEELTRAGYDFEILGVDDGSDDDSASILIALAHQDPRLRALRNLTNEGKGSAVQKGVLAARGQWIVTLDADLATDLEVLARAQEALSQGAGLVLGDRRHPDSRILVRQSVAREQMGRLFSCLARVLITRSIGDFTCGFKAFRGDIARRIFGDVETARWAFDVEVIAIALRSHLRIVSLPVQWSDRRETRVRLPGDAFRAFIDLIRIAWLFRAGGYQ